MKAPREKKYFLLPDSKVTAGQKPWMIPNAERKISPKQETGILQSGLPVLSSTDLCSARFPKAFFRKADKSNQ